MLVLESPRSSCSVVWANAVVVKVNANDLDSKRLIDPDPAAPELRTTQRHDGGMTAA
jgi:hypothetical protein